MVQDNLTGLHLHFPVSVLQKKREITVSLHITKLKHSERIMRRKLHQTKSPKLINMSLSALIYGCRETVILKND